MNPIPIDLPVRMSEAAAVAAMVFEELDDRPLDDAARTQLTLKSAPLDFASLRPEFRSLESDPGQTSAYFIFVDGISGPEGNSSILLHFAPSTGSARLEAFEGVRSLGRMRPGGGRELSISAIPFASRDHANIRAFIERTGSIFLPRPQGAQSAIATGNRHPEISLPAAFAAFCAVQEKTGKNWASTVQLSATREMTLDENIEARDGENPVAIGHTRVSIRHLFHCGLWAAARSGWRDGYTAEADHIIVTGSNEREIAKSLEAAKEAIIHASGYTKFTTDASRMFELEADIRHPRAWTPSEVEQRFEQLFDVNERNWVLSEFSQPFSTGKRELRLDREQIVRLAVKFGRSLRLNEELFDAIRAAKRGAEFDFEPSIDEAETLTTAAEMYFYMRWLSLRGRPAQLVPPNLGFKKRQAYPVTMESTVENGLGLRDYASHKMWPELCHRVETEFGGRPLSELGSRVRELAGVARLFDGTLSIHSGSGKQAEVLEEIGHATQGRVNYKISGELQLQLLDVLFEQPADSPWKHLYNRMVARCYEFAARGDFGEESDLAQKYLDLGRGFYLGDAKRGRVDGNLFLVFWLGNLAGTRDVNCPNADTRFFTEKFLDMPREMIAEVRRRNSAYIEWLVRHLS